MLSQADQLETLGLMAAHEAAVGDLYLAYAGRFPDSAALFESLVAGERDHARAVAGFADEVRAGRAHVRPGRFSSHTILASLEHVRACAQQARAPGLTLLAALSTGLDLEEAMIEKRFFEILDEDGAELKALCQQLARDTAAHRAQLREAWERERAG